MNLWYKKSVVFVVAGISYLVGQYFRGVWFLGSTIPNVCGHAEAGGIPFCNSQYLGSLGWPLITLGETIAIIGLILLLANARAFHTWLKFSYWYIPIPAAFVIFMTPFPLVPLASPLSSEMAIYDFGVIWQYVTAGIVIVYIVIFLIQKIKAWREIKLKKDVVIKDKITG